MKFSINTWFVLFLLSLINHTAGELCADATFYYVTSKAGTVSNGGTTAVGPSARIQHNTCSGFICTASQEFTDAKCTVNNYGIQQTGLFCTELKTLAVSKAPSSLSSYTGPYYVTKTSLANGVVDQKYYIFRSESVTYLQFICGPLTPNVLGSSKATTTAFTKISSNSAKATTTSPSTSKKTSPASVSPSKSKSTTIPSTTSKTQTSPSTTSKTSTISSTTSKTSTLPSTTSKGRTSSSSAVVSGGPWTLTASSDNSSDYSQGSSSDHSHSYANANTTFTTDAYGNTVFPDTDGTQPRASATTEFLYPTGISSGRPFSGAEASDYLFENYGPSFTSNAYARKVNASALSFSTYPNDSDDVTYSGSGAFKTVVKTVDGRATSYVTYCPRCSHTGTEDFGWTKPTASSEPEDESCDSDDCKSEGPKSKVFKGVGNSYALSAGSGTISVVNPTSHPRAGGNSNPGASDSDDDYDEADATHKHYGASRTAGSPSMGSGSAKPSGSSSGSSDINLSSHRANSSNISSHGLAPFSNGGKHSSIISYSLFLAIGIIAIVSI